MGRADSKNYRFVLHTFTRLRFPVCDNVKTFMCRSILVFVVVVAVVVVITTRIRSLREGYIFSPVCLSVCPQWCILMWPLLYLHGDATPRPPPSTPPSDLFTCNPYIYWQTGCCLVTERLCCGWWWCFDIEVGKFDRCNVKFIKLNSFSVWESKES